MTGSRYGRILATLRRLIPGVAPTGGWRYARQRIEAYELSGPMSDQADAAELQLVFPDTLARQDAGGWGADAHTWRFTPTPNAGASDVFLDLWGRTLSVPRVGQESDAAYAQRILTELTLPVTNNTGMAQWIDRALGTTGTQVIDAWDLEDQKRRFNDAPTWRLNDTIQLEAPLEYPASYYRASFRVALPIQMSNPWNASRLTALINRRKAAGTRLLDIKTPATGGSTGYGFLYGLHQGSN